MIGTELERIVAIAQRLGGHGADGVTLGIGDDAAVLDACARGARQMVWTVDAQVEGTHFRADLARPRDIGWRSFMAAASDLAAMGATPWCALSSLVLSPRIDDDALAALVEGQAAAARRAGAPIVGGNLARGDALSVTTTLLGTCDRAVTRAAREGDGLWIAGPVGLAAAGFLALDRGESGDALAPAIEAWLRPIARIEDGLAMASIATGAIDVSDGLAHDLAHIARASGLVAVIDAYLLEAHTGEPLARAAKDLGVDPMELALHGGEDYALIVASAQPIAGFTRIGAFEGRALESELVALRTEGTARPVEPRGFDHFARQGR